jgi:hypothetical protein
MAIVVLVLWLFTAGAGFYLLVTSSLGRARPASPESVAPDPQPARASTGQSALASTGHPASVPTGREASRREMRREARNRWDPPSLTAAKKAPVLPGAWSLMEFAHPACALIGLAFWLGFTMVHNRALGWIAFGLIAVTASMGLAWFTANALAARRGDGDRPAPHFAGRLMVLHGCAAAVTITLAALTALVTRG